MILNKGEGCGPSFLGLCWATQVLAQSHPLTSLCRGQNVGEQAKDRGGEASCVFHEELRTHT